MASRDPDYINSSYQAVPHTSDDAENEYHSHSHELAHFPPSTDNDQGNYFRLQHADTGDDAFQPRMDTYERKGTVGTQFSTTAMLKKNHAMNTPSWLPHFLRWQILSSIIALTVVLEILVAVFHGISSRDSGLVDDDGSGGIVVASKFVPTVLAVIHVLIISICLNDVKRTQAFAYLTSSQGSLGKNSLTWTAEAWWDALAKGFPGRGRKTNWALLCAALAFIFGFMIVSPFSSSLFVTEDIIFTYQVPFDKLDMSSTLPIQASPVGATYFRTVGNILQNVTTSAWTTDKYAIQPIWPARINSAPLGPQFTDSMQTWTAKTTVYNVEDSCEQMSLERIYHSPSLKNGAYINYTSVTLTSPSGCLLNVSAYDKFNVFGGSAWGSLPNLTATTTFNFNPDDVSFTQDNCKQDEFILYTTPWSDNMTATDVTIVGQACYSKYYMGDTNATVNFNGGSSLVQVNIDEPQYMSSRVQIPSTTANMSTFQDTFLSSNWSIHLRQPTQNAQAYALGPATLLSALYNFSPGQMINDSSILQNTGKLKQRFFGELLRDQFDDVSSNTPTSISGTTSENRRRVVVVPAVAIVLEITLGIQLILLAVVFFMTRLSRRPLGLVTDPAPAMSIAKLIAKEPGTLESFQGLHSSALEEIRSAVADQRYHLTSEGIHLETPGVDDLIQNIPPEFSTNQIGPTHSRPQSFAFGLWLLVILTLLLSATLVVIAYLYWYSGKYGLYQTAFVYAFDISIGGVDLSNVNPASIVTTFIAVLIGLWWGALETTLRRVQPFLALAKEPVAGGEGVLVSYISSYLLLAVWKASRRRHWVLAAICMGAFLAEIFTIAMSSIWQREPGTVPFQVDIQRQLELRQVPHLSEGTLQFTSHAGNYKQSALASLFSNMRTSWIYGAAVQISLNGSEPAWSSDGWSFVPINLASVPEADVQNIGNQSALTQTSMNVTVATSGIRGRLECSPFEHLSLTNTTNWITQWDLTNATQWNQTSDPDLLKTGYELGLSRLGDNTMLFTDNNASTQGNYTTFFANNKRIACCENITDGVIGTNSVGYWSPNLANNAYYPDFATSWPANFTVKWIHGRGVEGYQEIYTQESEMTGSGPARMMWAEKPQMSALNCMPIIETVNASVTVSTEDSHVISFDLIDEPQPDPYAWTDDFKQHKTYTGICEAPQCSNIYSINITTSHGILFITGLLGAADLDDFEGTDLQTYLTAQSEETDDQTFNIRQAGLNVDLMTYSMLSLVNYDHEALLDMNTLQSTAQKTFTALFQNYASNNVSFETGGYVFQSPSEALPSDLDTIVNYTRRADDAAAPASSTVTLHVSRPVELLQMSKPAAWICMLILGYLIVASVILTVASRRYTKMLLRRIESIADIVVLMAGSEKLLQLAREKSIRDLKADHSTKARLGWFTGADGTLRWGIELVGGDSAKGIATETPPHENQQPGAFADAPRAAENTSGSPPEYNADGVSLLSSSASPGTNHVASVSEPSQARETASLSPTSAHYHPPQPWHNPYDEHSAPPRIDEHRAPSLDVDVDNTPFSSYFRRDDDAPVRSRLSVLRRNAQRRG
ncbi:hypothetical protein F4804DRAFT_330350 [Jackrogersella minutella]|nr:hypothetical protein F4804DRAFT_330350 [Jackrogersella minutella]